MRSAITNFSHLPFAISLLFVGLLSFSAISSGLSQSALTLEGKPFDPLRASPGKITVLIFVRTDCPISNRYAPAIQRLYEDRHLLARFWLVFPDKKTTPQQIRDYLEQFHYKIPALRDPGHILAKHANATITPEAAVFGLQGRLLYHGRIDNWYEDASRARPAATTHELHDAIESALSGKTSMPVAAPAIGCYISDL